MATIDNPRAIRVKTSTGWADLVIQGPPGADGADGEPIPPRLAATMGASAPGNDLDLAVESGWYWYQTSTLHRPPTGNGYGYMQVYAWPGVLNLTQVAYPHDVSEIWLRSAGSAWQKVFPSAVASVPARLGPQAQTITDWNTAKDNGWYMAAGAANAPTASAWYIGTVSQHNADWVTQEVWDFTYDTNFGRQPPVYTRRSSNGIWGAWQPPAYHKLYERRLTGGNWFDISGIDQTFSHLKIIVSARSDLATTGDQFGLRFNNDASASYSWQRFYGQGTGVNGASAQGETRCLAGWFPGANAALYVMGATEILIPDYRYASFYRAWNGVSGMGGLSGQGFASTWAGSWSSGAAISQIQLYPASGGNFVAGSRISLYGMA